MGRPYTSGNWVVNEGSEQEFVAAWSELARWSRDNAPGAISVVLLQDLADRTKFVSVGPWESLEAIEAWRALPGFQERVGKLRDLLDSFEARTLELVAEA